MKTEFVYDPQCLSDTVLDYLGYALKYVVENVTFQTPADYKAVLLPIIICMPIFM